MVTSSLMQILTTRGLFSGLPFEDPLSHIAKARVVCKSSVSRPDLDLDVIGLRVVSSLTDGRGCYVVY